MQSTAEHKVLPYRVCPPAFSNRSKWCNESE